VNPSLINDGGTGEAHPWNRSPVSAEQQIRGLGPIMISIPDRKTTDLVLPRAIGMREVRDYATPARGERRPRPALLQGYWLDSSVELRRGAAVSHPRRRLPRLAERLQSHAVQRTG
jgi:hypothetical protein